jgi:putative transposase
MPWKESSVMNERVRLINDYGTGEFGVGELAHQYSVSRKTVYKWIERYEENGWRGLEDQSRAPHHHPNGVPQDIELEFLRLKERKPFWGAPKLRRKLLESVGPELCPAESTLSEILKRHGLSRKQKRPRRAVPSEQPLAHCAGANQVWCADFKGWFRTGDGQKCTPLTISDAFSRYLLCCQGLGETTGYVTVQPLFIATFREYGVPEAIRTDNGAPFACACLGGLTRLSVWWLRLGIRLERIEPGQPQQNGRHERMHRTLKEATAQPPQSSLRAQQKCFNRFRDEYNNERPHEALNQEPPASVYEPAPRQYPERLPGPCGYPDEWEKRIVRKGGQMRWKGQDIRLSEALWGQQVGFEPIGDGIWNVHFEALYLGVFDERKGRIQRRETL